MNDQELETSRALRTGFTTGACAAAAATAAWKKLNGMGPGEEVGVFFPDGQLRRIELGGTGMLGTRVDAWVVKDAGDDVDVTDKAVIHAQVSNVDAGDVLNSDYVENCDAAEIVIRAGNGVGRVTRKGLDVPVGKWAINSVPRRMIVENLERAGAGKKKSTLLVEVSIENGAALARKTLNPILGIEDGLSILGTSGLVIPCSNKAYIATIRVLVRGAAECGCRSVVLVTGGRTHRLARGRFPELPEIVFIRIGDFIKESLECCSRYGFERILVVCMPGKLAKYARGHAYTHARTVAQSMEAIAAMLLGAGLPEEMVGRCRYCRSMREFLQFLEPDQRTVVLEKMRGLAEKRLTRWTSGARPEIIIIDPDEEETK